LRRADIAKQYETIVYLRMLQHYDLVALFVPFLVPFVEKSRNFAFETMNLLKVRSNIGFITIFSVDQLAMPKLPK
jgi:hypothetical protein